MLRGPGRLIESVQRNQERQECPELTLCLIRLHLSSRRQNRHHGSGTNSKTKLGTLLSVSSGEITQESSWTSPRYMGAPA